MCLALPRNCLALSTSSRPPPAWASLTGSSPLWPSLPARLLLAFTLSLGAPERPLHGCSLLDGPP